MRAFVALELPDACRQQLAAAAGRLRGLGDVRWVEPQQLHLTLKFLGDIDDRQAAAMTEVVSRTRWPRPRLRLGGLGRFPARGAPRVLWAGIDGDVATVHEIAAQLEHEAGALGVPAETRPFRAHVTLGRCRSGRGAAPLVAALEQPVAGGRDTAWDDEWSPEAVVLYRSDLQPDGPVYRALARGGQVE